MGRWLIVISFAISLSTSQQAMAGWPEANAAEDRGDYTAMFHEWMQMALQGDPVAQNNVGFGFERGKGVSVDYAQAKEWYTKAAEHGLAEAEKNLGLMYALGHGVKKDGDQENFWLRKAAAQGHPQALYLLGSNVLEADPVEAVAWIRQAAEQGYAHADVELGEMYRDGNHVPCDIVLAYKWFVIAARSYPPGEDRDQAIAASEGLRPMLTAEQQGAADALVAAWKPTKVPTPVSPGIPLPTEPQ